MPHKTGLNSISNLMGKVFELPSLKAFNAIVKIKKDWKFIVGKRFATELNPLAIKNNTLWIGTSHPVWSQEAQFQKNVFLTNLKERYGNLPIKNLKFFFAPQLFDNSPAKEKTKHKEIKVPEITINHFENQIRTLPGINVNVFDNMQKSLKDAFLRFLYAISVNH